MNKTRVLIVDDHPFFRSGIVQWLNQQPSLICCGETDTIAATRSAVTELKPDIILLDLRLGDGDGLDLLKELSETHPRIRVIALSQHEEGTYAHRALRLGARGYVMKSEATDTVFTAIETVSRGEVFISRSVSSRLTGTLFPDPVSSTADLARLTDRELQVFQMLGAGGSTRDIAERLQISSKTVESYREHLKKKLRLPDSRALLRTATLWVEKGRIDTR